MWAMLWSQLFPFIFPISTEFQVIGWMIPGLIANHMERQGVVVTTASLVTVTVAIRVARASPDAGMRWP